MIILKEWNLNWHLKWHLKTVKRTMSRLKSLKFIVQTEQTLSGIRRIFGFVSSTYRRSSYILIEGKKKQLSLKRGVCG